METKVRMTGVMILALLFVAGVCCYGEDAGDIWIPENMGLNYSFHAGAAFFVGTALNNPVFPTVGLSWFDSAGDEFGRGSTFGISADWTYFKRLNGQTVNMVPLLVNYRQYGNISSYRVFLQLGVGLLATTDSVPELQLSNGANWAWSGGIGLDITNELYIMSKFVGSSHPDQDGFITAVIGYRF